MKKVLVLAAVIAMFATASFAQEFSFKNFKLYGEGSIIGTYEDYASAKDDNYSGVYNQFLLGVTFDIHQNIQAAVALGYEPWWGDAALDGKTIDENENGDPGYFNQVRVVEANITLNNLFDVYGLKAKVGRQFYGDEDSTVMYLGVRHYNAENLAYFYSLAQNKITSIDALSGYYENGNLKANAIYGVFAGPTVSSTNIAIAGADVKYADLIKDTLDIQGYWYELTNADSAPGSALPAEKYGIIGVKPTYKMKDFKAFLEFALNYDAKSATGNKYSSNLIKLDASYDVKSINLTPRATYMLVGGYSSKDNFDKVFYNLGNYTPGLIYGQENYQGDDDEIINAGVDYKLNKFTFSFDYYNLSARDNRYFWGEELDAFVKYQYTENTEVFAGVGHMFAGTDYNGGQDVSKGMLGVTYKIK